MGLLIVLGSLVFQVYECQGIFKESKLRGLKSLGPCKGPIHFPGNSWWDVGIVPRASESL